MRIQTLLVPVLLIASQGCDVSEVSDPVASAPTNIPATPAPVEQPAVTAEPAPVAEQPPAVAQTTAPVAEETEAEDEFEGWWQLMDDSILTATFEPTPPRAGKNKMLVEVTQDDFEENFGGTLAYRLSPAEESDAPWIDLTKLREDEDGTAYYEAEIDLPPGGAFVQFHLKDAGDEEFTDLTDWKLKPR